MCSLPSLFLLFFTGRNERRFSFTKFVYRGYYKHSFSKRYLANFYNRLGYFKLCRWKYRECTAFYNLASDYAKRSNDKLILYRIMNNAGDVGRYLYGPKSSIKYNLEAYEMAKDFPKDFMSLSNLINAKAQFCKPSNEIEDSKELEEMLKDVNIEYFLYIGYRRLALSKYILS